MQSKESQMELCIFSSLYYSFSAGSWQWCLHWLTAQNQFQARGPTPASNKGETSAVLHSAQTLFSVLYIQFVIPLVLREMFDPLWMLSDDLWNVRIHVLIYELVFNLLLNAFS